MYIVEFHYVLPSGKNRKLVGLYNDRCHSRNDQSFIRNASLFDNALRYLRFWKCKKCHHKLCIAVSTTLNNICRFIIGHSIVPVTNIVC